MDRSGKRVLLGLFGAGIMIALYACGEVGGSGQCGGAADSGSCVKVESILPTYKVGGGFTSNVDAFIDICDPGPPVEYEEITDHNATVTFINEPLPDAPIDTTHDVTITQYTMTYTLNNCPFTAGGNCPPLLTQTVTPGETILIPANGTVTRDIKLVDLGKKQEYASKIGDDLLAAGAHTLASLQFPSYTVTYRFTGTDIFNNKVNLTGYTEFTIGDYDYCN